MQIKIYLHQLDFPIKDVTHPTFLKVQQQMATKPKLSKFYDAGFGLKYIN